jgi:hypothetical protein
MRPGRLLEKFFQLLIFCYGFGNLKAVGDIDRPDHNSVIQCSILIKIMVYGTQDAAKTTERKQFIGEMSRDKEIAGAR